MRDYSDIETILTALDPAITKWAPDGSIGNYTYWTPGGIPATMADDAEDDATRRFYVERFTKLDPDPMVSTIYDGLGAAGVSFEYEDPDYEPDTHYIHHTFTCYL